MTWLTVYREAAGWFLALQAACLAYITWLVKHRPRARLTVPKAPPEPGDDVMAMLRQWTDDAVDAELERMTREGGGQDG